MILLLLTLGCFAVIMTAMAVGLLLRGRRLRGSCGGVENEDCACKRYRVEPRSGCPKQAPRLEAQRLTAVRGKRRN